MNLPKQSPPVRRDYIPESVYIPESDIESDVAKWYFDLDLDYPAVREYLRSKSADNESIWDEIW